MIDQNVVDKSGNTNLQRGALKALLSSLKICFFHRALSGLDYSNVSCHAGGRGVRHVTSDLILRKKKRRKPFLLFVLHSMVQIAVMFHAMLAGGNMSCHVRSH